MREILIVTRRPSYAVSSVFEHYILDDSYPEIKRFDGAVVIARLKKPSTAVSPSGEVELTYGAFTIPSSLLAHTLRDSRHPWFVIYRTYNEGSGMEQIWLPIVME